MRKFVVTTPKPKIQQMEKKEGFEKYWNKFVDNCGTNLPTDSLKPIKNAFDFQQKILTEQLGDDAKLAAKPSYKVARIVVNEINLQHDAIIASILLNLIDLGLKDIALKSEHYTGSIQQMLSDSMKIRRMQTDKVGIHAENFIKLILTISADMRVILVELAWKMYYMRKFDSVSERKRKKILTESKLLYAPIAHRLGLYAIKTELEDLWLKHSKPQTYKDIARQLDETKRDRERFIEDFVHPIQENLEKASIECELKGRPKSIHSIWNKMQKQGVGFEKVYDKFAIRIILENLEYADEKPMCWRVYSAVTENYRPFPKRLRDWISAPKSSGYESLHTTVETETGKWVEVQIRTRRMDDIAEKGQAAHWKYKEKEGEDSLDAILKQMRSALEKNEEERDADREAIKDALYAKEIFVFTPNGDLKKQRAKASVLDFAFGIHTNLGAHCKGAMVNGKYVTNKHILENGDTVEVVTSKSVKVSPSWINHVASPRAKTKIKRLLKEQEFTYADLGKEMLYYKLKQWKVDRVDDAKTKLMKLTGIDNTMELFDAIAQDKIDLGKFKKQILDETKVHIAKPDTELTVENTIVNKKGTDPLIIEHGKFSMEYNIARCCNPIPGDNIFGFVSVKQGVKVHKLSCPNAKDLLTRYPYRVIPTRWSEAKGDYHFITTLRIDGNDRVGLANDLTRTVLDTEGVLLKAIDAKGKGNFFSCHLALEVENTSCLTSLTNRIKGVAGVKDVYRPE